MTVTENIAMLAGYPRRFHMISWAAARSAAESAIALMGGGVDPDARVGDLPAAEKSIVAIARAIALESDFLVLDEPTAALPESDVARLHAVLRRLRASGLGIIYVTHRLDEVFRIADRVTVLRDGRWVTTRKVSDTTPELLVHDIVGRSLSNLFAQPPATAGDLVLSIDKLVAEGVGPINLDVFSGEIIGLVGLRGAGHDIVGRAIFGDVAITSGSIALDGQVLGIQNSGGRCTKRHRICVEQTQRGEPRIQFDSQGEPLSEPRNSGLRAIWTHQSCCRAVAVPSCAAAICGEASRIRSANCHLVRRKSAKGRRGPMAGGEQPALDTRGADIRS